MHALPVPRVGYSAPPDQSAERMSHAPSLYTDIAESILEHAQAITRLPAGRPDAGGRDGTAYELAFARHVNAMRVLAVAYIDPLPDRELVRALKTLSSDVPGVFVQLADGAIELIVDNPGRQHKVKLWNRQQLLKNEQDDRFEDD